MTSPAGATHGIVAMRLGSYLTAHVEPLDLGYVFAAETGFKIESSPDLVRAPDASFVTEVHAIGRVGPTFFDGVPDLAVEVVSPDDTKR